ncbi:MAG: alpha/beta hydrolase, partial [Campylobacterales bacterium]|nr:alpha/beta hydrolase [Campylobacterales bacterium]
GPLILFLHGFPEFWYQWRNLLPEFSKDHRVVAPDMRGYNLSDKPTKPEQYQMHYLVEDVRALVEHLGYQRFTLVAHDWGGFVAWNFAMAHPDCLDRLIIVNSPHTAIFRRELAQNPMQQHASTYMQLFRNPRAEAILSAKNYAKMTQMLFGSGLFGSEEETRSYITAWSQPGALTGGLNYYRAMTGQKSVNMPELSSAMINVPTLVIWGEKDTALLATNLDGLEQYVPELTVKRIPDGTHWVIHEEPQTIIAMMREFLAEA